MYKITIILEKEEVRNDREYKKISDTGNPKDDGAVYGYVDNEKTIRTEATIYEQRVADILLADVIKAVNKLK